MFCVDHFTPDAPKVPTQCCIKQEDSYKTWMKIQLHCKETGWKSDQLGWKSDQLGWNPDQSQRAAVF